MPNGTEELINDLFECTVFILEEGGGEAEAYIDGLLKALMECERDDVIAAVEKGLNEYRTEKSLD